MYGTQYFRASDIPYYYKGLEIMIGTVAAGLALVVAQELIYYFHNRKAIVDNRENAGEDKQKMIYVS